MSEEILSAAGLLDANAVQRRQIADISADLARARSDLAAAIQSRDQALASAEAERAARIAVESQLGAALAEAARLEETLRQAARMFTIMGARRVIAAALDDPSVDQAHRIKK